MKQVLQLLMVTTFTLLLPIEHVVHAQSTGTRSRFIAKTLECFAGGSFNQCEDSLRIRWHDTAGADFDYFFYMSALTHGEDGYNAYYGYYFDTYIGYDTISPRAFAEFSVGLFDSLWRYAPPSTGLPNPWVLQTQNINSAYISEGINTREGTNTVDRQEYFYNASGDRIATKNYGDVPLILKSIDSFFYDNNGNLLSVKQFNMVSGTPALESLEEYIYNSNNQVVQSDQWISLSPGAAPSAVRRLSYTYSTTGQRTATVQQLADAFGVLKNSVRYDFTYNSNGQTLSRTWGFWSGTAWDTTGLIRYGYGTFDAPEVAYIQLGGSTDTSRKFSYFFNSNGRPDSIISYSYLGPGQWYPQQKRSFLYNAFDQPTLLDQKSKWNNATQTWDYYNPMDFKMRLYYETFNPDPTDVKNVTSPLTFSIYPNPVRDALHIRLDSEAIRLLSVYDLAGRLLIRQQPGYRNSEVTLHLGSLPAGVYTLKIDGEQSYGSKKIIVY